MDIYVRIKIWRALSDLFLDTEINDVTYKYIAKTIQESELSLSEIENILWYEVYPALESNLRSVAGVWEGWSDEWLLENLKVCERPNAIMGSENIIDEIKDCWLKIIEFLPREKV